MRYLCKRLVVFLLTLFFVSILSFVAFQLIPSDSALLSLGLDADEAAVEALRESLGLNRPALVRYFDWLTNALRGDFGISTQYRIPVSSLLSGRLAVTVWLGVLSLLMIVGVALPLGILAAKREGGVLDRVITISLQTLMALPPFFLGIVLTLIFGVLLHVFTPGAYVAPEEDFGAFLRYLLFPAAAVAIPKIAMTAKFLRSSVLGELKADYVRTARSKGGSRHRILWRHVLRNALMPVVTFFGMLIAEVLAGSIIVEQVFALPGMGRLLITAISNRDFYVVQAIVLYIAAVVVAANFVVDVLYRYIDPRVASV